MDWKRRGQMEKGRDFVKKRVPESIYDFPAIETWLSDCAAEGLVLERINETWATFREEDPETRQFRLEPRMDRPKTPDQELQEVYQAAGWEFVSATEDSRLWLWRSCRPDPAELHTEPETEALALDWVAKVLRSRILLDVCLMLVIPALLGLCVMQSGVVLGIARNGYQTMPVSWWALLFVAGLFCNDLMVFRRQKRALAAGIPRGHRAAYGSRTRLWNLYLVVCVLLIILGTVDTFGNKERTVYFPEEPVPVVSALKLGYDRETGVAFLNHEPFTADFLDVWWDRSIDDARERKCEVYDLRSLSPFAGQMMRDLSRIQVQKETGEKPERMEDERFDDLRYLRTEDDTQYLLVRRGGRVLYLMAEGANPLLDCLEDVDWALSQPMPTTDRVRYTSVSNTE